MIESSSPAGLAYEPRAATTTIETSGVQRLGERAIAFGGAAVEQLLGTAWRFHLGRRAARAPRADVVVSGGILKLHLSDHRRRVLGRFETRLDELRTKWLAQGSRSTTEVISA